MIEHLLPSLLNAITPYHLFLVVAGVAGGIIVGSLPGLTAVMAVTVMMPFTLVMEPASGLVMLGAIFSGAIYGGANSAILLNIPGTPSALATTFDGYPMARQGRAYEGLYGSLVASVVGGLFGVAVLLLFFEPLARFGLNIGAPEYFWLAMFGLTTIAAMSGEGGLAKGLLGAALGVLASTVGLDPFTAATRFTFDIPQMQLGIVLVPALLGLFSVTQMLAIVKDREHFVGSVGKPAGVFRSVTSAMFRRLKLLLLRSSAIGTFIGMLPGAGGSVASLVAYNESMRWSRDPDRYGKGAIEGLATSESANNAQVAGTLVPMMGLGIPGSAVAAVMMGGLLSHGIQPGPQLLTESADVAYTFIVALLIANILMLPVGYLIIKVTVQVLNVRSYWLIPTVLALSVIGSLAPRGQVFDIYIMVAAGIIGYLLHKVGVSAGPISLGIILGPIIENNLGVSVRLAQTEPSLWHVLALRPISAVLILLTAIALITPLVQSWRKRAVQRAGGSVPHSQVGSRISDD